MDNNFNNENDEVKNINSGFEPPSSNDPLNLGLEEPYVQTQTTTAADNLAAVKPKKSHKGLIIALASLGTVIAACIACVLFIPSVNNFFKLYTQKPAAYYQDVEKKNIEENIEKNSEHIKELTSYMAEITGELAKMENTTSFESLADIPWVNSTGYCNLELTVNEQIKTLIAPFAENMDSDANVSGIVGELINSLDSVSINSIATINEKQQVAMDLSFTLNNSKVISANMIIDVKNYAIYFAVPEIIDTVYSVKIPQDMVDKFSNELNTELDSQLDELQEVYKKLDDAVSYLDDNSDEFVEFIEKYSNIVVETLDEATINKNTAVDVNEVEVEYTEIIVKVDGEKLSEIIENILDALKDDDFAIGLAEKMGMSKDDYSMSFDKILKSFEESKDTEKDNSKTIDLVTYVNTKGEIVGRGFKAGDVTITYATYEKDEETQFQLTISNSGEDAPGHMNIKGICKGEDTKSGYVVYECDIEEYDFNIKGEFEDAKVVNEELGYFEGKYTITTNLPELEPFAIVIDAKATKKDQTVTFDVLYNDAKTITLELSAGEKDYEEIKIPSSVFEITPNIDAQSLIPELQKINLVNLKDNVKKAINSDTLNTTIDYLFEATGLNIVDGDMTEEEVNQVISALSEDYYEDEDEVVFDTDTDIDMDYDISYDDENI
ncbi:MAG: hypothetical protein IJD02_00555 [Lachnospiraceae bacterium]|nr:hypothetical protein [Lachnospiraceae bacterium]